jgi:hypothetical protein
MIIQEPKTVTKLKMVRKKIKLMKVRNMIMVMIKLSTQKKRKKINSLTNSRR